MPTENRSSNTEMVSFPRELSDDLAELIATRARVCGGGAFDIWEAICEGFGAPAPQPHPEPIAWMVGTAFWWTKEEAERDAAATGLPMIPVGPLSSSAEADQLREVIKHSDAQIMRQSLRISNQRAQLAERDALLREAMKRINVNQNHEFVLAIDASLSASAEPSAPIAWHVGGNGYDRVCFEEPTALPGHPCIQPIHDQRQLIELLKRYDLRDEDLPPDERAHGIPGTSFQRLNALANQGD